MNKLPEKIIETKGQVTSFGGRSLAENMKEAERAIAKMNYTERIWDRSRSQFTLKNLVTSYPSDWKNLRQISAEMQRKRDALREAKFSYAKKLQEAEIKRIEVAEKQEQLNVDTPPLQKERINAEITLLEIEIAEIMEGAEAGVPKIEGALKEIMTLEKMHDELTERLNEIGEDAFEKHEARSHIKYALIQAVREVRAVGRINTGVQEYLEQCGVNITHAFRDINNFLGEEAEEGSSHSTRHLYEWLEEMANKYEDCALDQTERLGFSRDHMKEIAYNKERDKR